MFGVLPIHTQSLFGVCVGDLLFFILFPKMENMWDDGKIYDSDEDDVQESEDVMNYSYEDDKFEFEDQNKRREFVENENLEHKQWAYGMLEYFADKWKQKNIGNPPSNWKEILIKLLDLEQYQSSNPSEDFERCTEDFNDEKDDDDDSVTDWQFYVQN